MSTRTSRLFRVPFFEAVSRNILRREFLTEDWVEAIELCGRLTYEDLSVFYLLREEVIPKDGYGDEPCREMIHSKPKS